MDTLHKHEYNLSSAISSLVPSTGPVLCRDEMEEWSASEANLFEEALEKYGKDFNDIRQDFVSKTQCDLQIIISLLKSVREIPTVLFFKYCLDSLENFKKYC